MDEWIWDSVSTTGGTIYTQTSNGGWLEGRWEMPGETDWWIIGKMETRLDGCMYNLYGWMEYGCMYGCVWMDWKYEWMNGCMDGWMEYRWMYIALYRYMYMNDRRVYIVNGCLDGCTRNGWTYIVCVPVHGCNVLYYVWIQMNVKSWCSQFELSS